MTVDSAACGSVHPQTTETGTRGLTIKPCAKPAGHAGRCVHMVEYRSPCPRCFHLVHSDTCGAVVRLAGIEGNPACPCLCPIKEQTWRR